MIFLEFLMYVVINQIKMICQSENIPWILLLKLGGAI